MKYGVDLNYVEPQWMWFEVEADDPLDAEYKAIQMLKEETPEARMIEAEVKERN